MSAAPERGILLVNLGSPESPSVPDVRRYLREFLMDPRVMDVPWPLRFVIVHGAILPFRPRASAEAYAKIWTDSGSPLVAMTARVQQLLADYTELPVELGMRYQQPTIASALTKLAAAGVSEVIVVPLFPHHAESSYVSAAERVKQIAAAVAPGLRLAVLPPYFDRAEYVEALVASASPYLDQEFDHLLFSFHGLPQRHIRKANAACGGCLRDDACTTPGAETRVCYRRHCLETVKRFLAVKSICASKVSHAFQSRLGMDAWLEPNSHSEIERLAASGVRKLVIICPAFTVDCLETLEEIGIRAKEAFLSAGGKEFTLIPCLNDHPVWIAGLAHMVELL